MLDSLKRREKEERIKRKNNMKSFKEKNKQINLKKKDWNGLNKYKNTVFQ